MADCEETRRGESSERGLRVSAGRELFAGSGRGSESERLMRGTPTTQDLYIIHSDTLHFSEFKLK